MSQQIAEGTVDADGEPLLSVSDLELVFRTEEGVVEALEGVDFEIRSGEVLGIIGESGCGKSVTARSVLGLLDENAEIRSGEIRYRGTNLRTSKDVNFEDVRGSEISMIFQEPQASLNPVFTVRRQLLETLKVNVGLTGDEAVDRAIELLEGVQLPSPESVLGQYPHQLSGGQQQRIMIALALACEPDILIADEPTTALDVTVQAEILKLMTQLVDEFDVSMLLVTHNLGVVAQTCDQVSVMYAGSVVETAATRDLFNNPKHPYTERLLESIPTLEHGTESALPTIPGVVPDLIDPPSGCRFRSRCHKLIQPEAEGLSKEGWNRLVELAHRLEDGRPVDNPGERFQDVSLGELKPDIKRTLDLLDEGRDEAALEAVREVLEASPCAAQRPPEVQAGASSTRCLRYGGDEL